MEDVALVTGKSFEDQLFPLFEDAAVGFGKVGLDCSWLRVNRKLCEMTGYTEAELLARTFIDITHPDDIQADLDNMKAVMAGALPINVMEKRYIRKDGAVVWIHLTATLARDAAGRPDYFIIVAEDITARKEAEASLRESEARLRRIADSGIIGVIYWRSNGDIFYANDAFLDIVGYTREDLRQGRVNWQKMTPPEYAHLDDKAWEELRAAGACQPFEKQYIRKDGSRVDVAMAIALLEDSSEEGVAIYRDVTEAKRAGEELKSFATRLEQSNRELEQFATVVSHDLLAPLRKVVMFGDALKASAGDLTEKQKDYVDRMQRATHRMQNLVTDLLDLSRINRKGQPFRKTCLRDILEEARADLLEDIQSVDGTIELGSVDWEFEADTAQFQQLFRNLIDNALKFHRRGVPPVVRIDARMTADGFCEITVQDNGIGFDEKHLDRIFGVFERLVGMAEYEGTGVGLSICQKIIERHLGTITAKSRPGEGATFIVRVPQRRPA